MDLWFIFGTIFTVGAVIAGFARRGYSKKLAAARALHTEKLETGGYRYVDDRSAGAEKVENAKAGRFVGTLATSILGGLAAFFLFMSTFVIITTSHKGVEMFAGKPGRTLSNGWNWKNPLATVVRWDGTVKTYKYSQETQDDGDPVPVLMANGGTANISLVYQWRLAGSIDELQRNYPQYAGDLDKLNLNLVKKAIQQELGIAYANYNPYANLEAQQAALLKAVQTGTAPAQVTINPATTYQAYGQQAFLAVRAGLATQEISLLSLTVSGLKFDDKTQSRIDALNNSIVGTQIALQNEATATATAAANATISKNPPTLAQIQQECVAGLLKALEEGHPANAGFVCPGTNGPTTVVPVN